MLKHSKIHDVGKEWIVEIDINTRLDIKLQDNVNGIVMSLDESSK